MSPGGSGSTSSGGIGQQKRDDKGLHIGSGLDDAGLGAGRGRARPERRGGQPRRGGEGGIGDGRNRLQRPARPSNRPVGAGSGGSGGSGAGGLHAGRVFDG